MPTADDKASRTLVFRPKVWKSPKGGFRARMAPNGYWQWFDAERVFPGLWAVFGVNYSEDSFDKGLDSPV